MNFNEKYTPLMRETFIQQIQMQMSEQRFQHVLGVEKTAVALAKKYGASEKKASIAALAHDYAKERPDDEFRMMIQNEDFNLELLDYGNEIWHGLVGVTMIKKELGIIDEEILQAIRIHTIGSAEMTLLDKIIYVADYIEPNRQFPGVDEARKLALIHLDLAVAYATKHTLLHLIDQERKIYPATFTTYNYWVAKNRREFP